MPADITPADLQRAETMFAAFDAAEPDDEALIEDPGPNPVALSMAQAREIAAQALADAREAGGGGDDCSEIQEQLEACQAQLEATEAQRAVLEAELAAARPWIRSGRVAAKGIRGLLELEQAQEAVEQEREVAQARRILESQRAAQAKVVGDVGGGE